MQEEKHGFRDMSYSAWHRRGSTGRFVGIEDAQLLAMIDLDVSLFIEYDNGSKEPLALIEVAVDIGQEWKTATVTKKLAKKASIFAYVVLYKLSEELNPSDGRCQDIESFRIKRLWPKPDTEWRTLTPKEWAVGLLKIRRQSTNKIDEHDGYVNLYT